MTNAGRARRFFTRGVLLGLSVFVSLTTARAAGPMVSVDTALPPPNWALLERELLRQNAAACREFFEKYFDERGWLLCVERWGGDDGPDDAIENCLDWPIIHALGGSDDVLEMYKHAWEGHLRQYTQAKTVDVPFARDGMYYKEFPVMMDWLHNGEGLVVFNLQGLSDPQNASFAQRVRRFAGFYMNEDPGAPNYDFKHRIIKSMFNGSRGPLMRKATGLDWAGDPIEVEHRFRPRHGESTYAQMLEHFKDYNDTVGDHPQNLKATTLALNAYLLTHDDKYRRWLLEYVDAWRERMLANGNIIPTNIGLDGKIGGETGGKWWGGVYGWGFTVFDPASQKMANRNQHQAGFQGFMNAYMLTGDDRYLDPWRKQIDAVNANKKVIDGKTMYPFMYGDKGWYDYRPEKFAFNALEIAYLSMKPEDLALVAGHGWLAYLAGKNADYPEQALRGDLAHLRKQVQGIRGDTTTPDTRLADDPMEHNPASVMSLIELMLGGLHPGRGGSALFSRLRYFDPGARRAGVPEDVGALIDEMTGDRVSVTLVNVNQLEPRTVIVQAGGYAEHRFTSLKIGDKSQPVDGTQVTVKLAPGAGARLQFTMKRYANVPTMAFPWNRE
ncbi:MAG TPA: hypothetical protein VL475_10995 [Planctomycetaceae bacterium]|nr:hypothetical protein [Planctomycetaceae bacterium]